MAALRVKDVDDLTKGAGAKAAVFWIWSAKRDDAAKEYFMVFMD